MSDVEKEVDRSVIPSVIQELNANLDIMSKRGVFGWDTIGNINIPYILRGEEHYLSVRMVEKKLLSKYPSKYPEEISNRPPLASEFITAAEATLLNEINRDHCQHGFGHDLFTTDDIIVKVQEFKDFFTIVQKHFGNIPQLLEPAKIPSQLEPGNIPKQSYPDKIPSPLEPGEVIKKKPVVRRSTGGWLQVNNTIIPFVYRGQTQLKFVPLSVVKYAAGLLTETNVDGYELSENECVFLTNICTEAGLTFNFTRPTKALPIGLICQMCKNVEVKELPEGDPFKHAEHSEDKVVASAVNNLPELTIPQSVLPSTHTPPEMVLPGTAMPPAPDRILPEIGMPPTHEMLIPEIGMSPTPEMVLPGTGMPHTNSNYHQNIAVSRQHSPIDSLMAHTAQQVSLQKQTLQPTVYNFNPAQAEVIMSSASKPAAHKSHTQTLTSQAQPTQKHLKKIQELHNRYLPQVYRPQGDIIHTAHHTMPDPRLHTAGSPVVNGPRWRMPHPHMQQHLSPHQQMQMHSQRLNQISPVGVPTHELNAKPDAVKIKPVELCGKTVSCISRKGLKYTLIEAVCKVFFPGVVLQEFEYAIEHLLKVPIHRLSDEEECAFLKFYELPPIAGGLSSKSSIYIAHFKEVLPRLRMMFSGHGQERPLAALKRQHPNLNPQMLNPHSMKSRKLDDTVKRLTTKLS